MEQINEASDRLWDTKPVNEDTYFAFKETSGQNNFTSALQVFHSAEQIEFKDAKTIIYRIISEFDESNL